MRRVLPAAVLLALAACEAAAPAPERPAPVQTGVSVSGYARVGVSHTF